MLCCYANPVCGAVGRGACRSTPTSCFPRCNCRRTVRTVALPCGVSLRLPKVRALIETQCKEIAEGRMRKEQVGGRAGARVRVRVRACVYVFSERA
jgi:hypothetical protein